LIELDQKCGNPVDLLEMSHQSRSISPIVES
jgi:hypothetical protein